MKILQINAMNRHLSTGRNMAELNDFFRQNGHEAFAAYSVGAICEPETDYLIGRKIGQKSHALLSRVTGLQGYYSWFATRKFLRHMDRVAPDVVILNNLHANYIHLPMLLKYLAKKDITTVAVLHDCWFYTGKCCHYTVAGCERWQGKCGNCPAKKKYNISWFFDRSEKMLQDKKDGFGSISKLGVIAVSDWLLNEAKKAPVFSKAVKMQRIYNWIDTEAFAPRDAGAVREEMGLLDKKIVLCVANIWDTSKGLDTALNIAEGLPENQYMILVGQLPDDTALPKNTIHIPKTNNLDRLIDLYNMADVFLQPSLEETFGKVSAEALACGTPVVCFNSTANPELIGPGCGGAVDPGDLAGMHHIIQTILQAGKEGYAEKCRAFAKKSFEKEESCHQYLTFCTELVTDNKEKE